MENRFLTRASKFALPFPGWVLLGALLLPMIYLPTLATRFDFIDDGNLVYATRAASETGFFAEVWNKTAANYDHLGPFRPVLWLHWTLAADVLDGSELGWRTLRLVWCGFAALALLWLFSELNIPRAAALMAAAIALWNPYRGEIWTSLTLSEGVAMPYALLALVAARRALASRHPWAWDIVGALSVLAALGCKNTFAAIVPAQMFLRCFPDGVAMREGFRRHGWRAAALGATLLAPIAHFAYFKWNWHEGQYLPPGPTLEQFRRIASGLLGATSFNFMVAGVLLAVGVQIAVVRRTTGSRSPARTWFGDILRAHRAALGAGLLLLVGGAVLYLPMDGMSGRYTMPGVWGLDLILAVALGGLSGVRLPVWSGLARGALACGLLAIALASVGKQQKFAARAQMLWNALEWVEREAPADGQIVWISGDSLKGGLNVEEGLHFRWHLLARGRDGVRIGLIEENGKPLDRCENPIRDLAPTIAFWGPTMKQAPLPWAENQRFAASYWYGRKKQECILGLRTPTAPSQREVSLQNPFRPAEASYLSR